MGSLIDEEIEESSFPNKVSHQETLIQAVTEKAVESQVYAMVVFYGLIKMFISSM